MNKIQVTELEHLFGASKDEILDFCAEELQAFNGNYQRLNDGKKDKALVEAIKKITLNFDKKSGPDRLPEWERGWSENLERFSENVDDLSSLVPGYVRPNQIMRFNNDYAIFEDPEIEKQYLALFRAWLSNKYFKPYNNIYEFGCGSCSHVAYLANRFVSKKIFGLDWAAASVKICNLLNEKKGLNVEGRQFDFFKPDYDLIIEQSSAVFTFGALEQCGRDFGPFIDYLVKKSPDICIHVEGLDELYDQSQLFDFLAYEYNKNRNYLTGLVDYLKALESDSKINILKIHRQKFGSRYNDTLSYVVWQPIKGDCK